MPLTCDSTLLYGLTNVRDRYIVNYNFTILKDFPGYIVLGYVPKANPHYEYIKVKPKGKYVFVLGKDKKETKALRRKFLELNKVYPYPKERGK